MRRAIVAAVAAVLSVLGVEAPAVAAPVNPTYTTLLADRVQTNYKAVPLVRSEAIPMIAGRSYTLTSSWSGKSTYNTGSLLEQRMRCSAPDVEPRNSARASTNVLAYATESIYNRWLFTAPITADYTCELLAIAGHTVHRDRFVDVTAGALTVYTTPRTGREWRITADDRKVNRDDRTATALRRKWTAPAGTTQVRVWSGPEVSCYSAGAHNPFVAEVTTIVKQVGAGGKTRKKWTHTSVQEIPGDLHHYKFSQSMTLDLLPNRPKNIEVAVRLRWTPYAGIPDRHGGILHGKSGVSSVYSALHIYPLAGA